MKKTLMTGIGFGLLVASSMALAYPLTLPVGKVRFTFTGFDAATTAYPMGAPVCGWLSSAGASAAACDAAGPPATSPTPGALPIGPGGSMEDTWGVFRVTSIIDTDTNTSIWNSTPTDSVLGMFYGLADIGVDKTGLSTTTFSGGGMVDFYGLPEPSGIPNPQLSSSGGGRTGSNSFSGYTGTPAQLLLSLQFATGQAFTGTGTYPANAPLGTTLSGAFNNNSFGGGSSAQLQVAVVGGTWGPQLNTNTINGKNGEKNDMVLSVTFRCEDATCNPANTPGQTVFSLAVDGGLDGVAVPEPATMGLLAMGLLSMGTFARQRRQVV